MYSTDETTEAQLRSFGFIVAAGFALIGMYPLLRGHDSRPWALVISGCLALPAVIMPRVLRQPYRVWMFAGHILGWINSRIILTVLFFAIFTPISLLMRLIGRDTMTRGYDCQADTYSRPKGLRPASHLKHQF